MNSDFVRSHIKILEDAVRAEQAKYPDRNVGPVSGLVEGVKYGEFSMENLFNSTKMAKARMNAIARAARMGTNLSMGSDGSTVPVASARSVGMPESPVSMDQVKGVATGPVENKRSKRRAVYNTNKLGGGRRGTTRSKRRSLRKRTVRR
jgi:hypothetical protein